MKKLLAFFLCLVMVMMAAVPAFATTTDAASSTDDTSATQSAGPLVITEVMPRSATEGFAYIEILNTSDTQIDLSNYYLYRFGFDNRSSKYYATSTEQMLALDGRGAQDVAAIKLNGTIDAGCVKLIWTNDGGTDQNSDSIFDVNDFVAYWVKMDSKITADDVIDLDFTGVYPNTIHGSTYHANTYKNFLPRNTYATFTLALVPASKATTVEDGDPALSDDTYCFDGSSANGDQRSVKKILESADSIALLNLWADYVVPNTDKSADGHRNYASGKSVNFYGFIEKETFNAAVDATVYREDVTNKVKYYYDDLYPALETTDPSVCEALMDFDTHNQEKVNKAIPMPKTRLEDTPSPGVLMPEQFVGRLVITEVCVRPFVEGYSYVEVLNTSDKDIDFSKTPYFLYRAAYANHTGSSQNPATEYATNTVKVLSLSNNTSPDLAAVKINSGTVKAGDVAVLWIVFPSIAITKEGFINWWNNNGAALSDDKVIAVEPGKSVSVGTNFASGGDLFLPRNTWAGGFALALVSESNAIKAGNVSIDETTNQTNSTYITKNVSTKPLFKAADCLVVIDFMLNNNKTDAANILTTYSAHFTAFIEKNTYNASVDATIYPDSIAAENRMSYYYNDMYPALAVADPNLPCKALFDCDTNFDWTTGNKALAIPDVSLHYRSTPGELDGEQYGFSEENISGPLAITEILNATATDSYEFIEIHNTSANDVELMNYSLFLFGFGNGGGQNLGAGMQIIYGNTTINTQNVSVADISDTSYILGKGETAVLWFDNTANVDEEELIGNFKTYWSNKGNDMTDVQVIRVPYTACANAQARGNGFLPEYKFGYSLALLDRTKGNQSSSWVTAIDTAEERTAMVGVDGSLSYYYQNAIIKYSDSVAVCMTHGRVVSELSQTYYSYAKDVSNAYQLIGEARAASSMIIQQNTQIYPNLVMTQNPEAVAFEQRTNVYSSTWGDDSNVKPYAQENTTFFDTAFDSVPTPGTLCEGQFGYTSKSDTAKIELLGHQCTTAVDGKTTVRIVGWIDSLDYENVVLEISAAVAATDDTTSTDAAASNAARKSELKLSTTLVYQAINGSDNEVYDLEYFEKDGGYLFAIVVTNVPTTGVKLTANCTATDLNGNVIKTGVAEFYKFAD